MTKITCLSGRRACRRRKAFAQTYKETSFGSDTLQVGASFVGSTCLPAGSPLVRRRRKAFAQTYKETSFGSDTLQVGASFGSDTLQVGASFVGSTCKPVCRTRQGLHLSAVGGRPSFRPTRRLPSETTPCRSEPPSEAAPCRSEPPSLVRPASLPDRQGLHLSAVGGKPRPARFPKPTCKVSTCPP